MRSVMWVWLAVCSAGCLPSTKVYKNPGENDCGVRYYRPKPYLMVKPMVDNGGQPVGGYVTMETVMMPDFSEEYSIHVRSGLGTNDTQITLADGWRLDALNVDIDSNFDENLKAVAEVAKAIPGLANINSGGSQMNVQASNVPLGYYEAVVSQGPDCKKRLYGFRYVGFMPYASCPIESCGLEQQICNESRVYALLFENNVMVFRPLGHISAVAAMGETESELIESGPAISGDGLLAPLVDAAAANLSSPNAN